MAQQFIKIFDDTVLKQSVNQGYETQRTNTRLGKFTMGELAFTRDTARLFVGNSTNLNLEKDSAEVTGGSLVGNKYLGLIDSKPLTHFYLTNEEGEAIESTVHLPLSYESDTISRPIMGEDGFNETITEKALLKSDSKFRTDSNDGWSKAATYNPAYDAYNGDFVFDVFSNALILFDKNIKPIDSNVTPNWEISDNQVQKFRKADGGFYTEKGDKSNFSKYRTRIQNASQISSTASTNTICGNPDYPVYGDGYVIMRIIEPDGVTIGYREKQFNQADGSAVDNNYSHNYLEVKNVPAETIIKSLNPKQFRLTTDNQISLTAELQLDGFTVSGSSITLPQTVIIQNGPTLAFTGGETSGYLSTYNNETKIRRAPNVTIKTDNGSVTHNLDPDGNYEFDFTTESSASGSSQFGYNVIRPWQPTSNETVLTGKFYVGNCQFDESGLFKSFEEVQEITTKIKNNETVTATDSYANFVLFDSSGKNSTYEITTENNTDGTQSTEYSGKFEHPYVNTGINYLKEPEPIAWGTLSSSNHVASAAAQFFLYPIVISPPPFNSGIKTNPNDNSQIISGIGTIGSVAESRVQIEQNGAWVDFPSGKEWDTNVADDAKFGLNTLMGVRIPDHATSIICEFHATLAPNTCCSVLTATHWEQCLQKPSDSSFYQLFKNVNLSSIPTQTTEVDGVKCLRTFFYSIFDGVGVVGTHYTNQVDVIEIPLYRDKNKMKYFNFGVNISFGGEGYYGDSKWVLRAIGYRA